MAKKTNVGVTTTEVVVDPLENLSVSETLVPEIVEDPKEKMASSLVSSLMATYNKPGSGPVMVLGSIGEAESKSISTLSKSLSSPIRSLMSSDSAGNTIGKQLVDLKVKIDEINPGKYNLNPGWFGRTIQKITGSSAVNRYVTKFDSAKGVIEAIANNLEEGILTLQENNIVFSEDQQRYRAIATALTEKIDVMNKTQEQLSRAIDVEQDGEKKKFLQQEVLFQLNQRLMDLQQLKAVCQQGDAALQILVQNNSTLIDSVNRTKKITLVAMGVGVTIAVGLDKQRQIMDQVDAVNDVTNNLIEQNGILLRTQGTEIQKRASSSMLDIDKLTKGITETIAALEDLENYRLKALPEMQKSINMLNNLTSSTDLKLENLQKSENVRLQHFETEE